jgi:hypothetical protein
MFQAEDLILQGFPKKIVELNELLETEQFGRRDLTEVHQPLNIPVPDPVVVNWYVQGVWKLDRSDIMQSVSTAMFLTNQESVIPYCRDCVFGTILY